jgi:DNA mismatch repair ATPase MutS
MVLEFSKYKYLWDWYVNSISQLDVLISMVKIGSKMAIKCMPNFTNKGLKIINGMHPGLLQVCKEVIPNTL